MGAICAGTSSHLFQFPDKGFLLNVEGSPDTDFYQKAICICDKVDKIFSMWALRNPANPIPRDLQNDVWAIDLKNVTDRNQLFLSFFCPCQGNPAPCSFTRLNQFFSRPVFRVSS